MSVEDLLEPTSFILFQVPIEGLLRKLLALSHREMQRGHTVFLAEHKAEKAHDD